MTRTGYVVFAHGSSIESANDAVRTVAAEVARTGGMELVVAAFLEGGTPSLADAVDALVKKGANEVIVVPYFLTLGLHLQRDLPRLIESARGAHPGLEIVVREPLDGHPAMVEALLHRALEAGVKADAEK
jgi:sirohydrochlorin ferrochelatase